MRESGVSTNLIVNSEAPPFDNPKIRRALALTLDRKAFIDILSEGKGKIGAASCCRRPTAVWGMPAGDAEGRLPGYGDVAQSARGGDEAHAEGGLRTGQAARRSRSARATSPPSRTRR